jgi:hypothetical protein
MLLFLIKSHLTGTPVTLSALASVAHVFRAPGRSGMFISAIFLRAQSPASL